MRIIIAILISSFWLVNDALGQRSVIDQMRLAGKNLDSNAAYIFDIPENEDYDFFVGQLSGSYTYPSGVLHNDLFYTKNDSLFTKFSFDYEGLLGTKMIALLNTPGGVDTIVVNITDVNGKWDANGKADIDLANKYPNVNVDDYIVWNYTSGKNIQIAPTGMGPANKILIHGKLYGSITVDLNNSQGLDSANKLVITNFLGQVESGSGIDLQQPNYVRLTGQYDSLNGYGHRYFKGCDKDGSTVSFGYSHGTYGIFTNNLWASETSGFGVRVITNHTGVEIDHLEIANGGFTGIKIGWPNNFSIVSGNYIHHNFIHDIGADGILLGQPSGFPQQVFQNAYIENNAIVRCGSEGIQATWIMFGSKIRNNFVHSAVDWKSPFARWQDGVIQVSSLGGGIDVENNIMMGGGSAVSDIATRNNVTPLNYPTDFLRFTNNLVYRNRTIVAFYLHSSSDGKTKVSFDGNMIGKLGYDLNEVYPNADTSNTKAFGLNNTSVALTVSNTIYDNSVKSLLGGSATPTLTNNQKSSVPAPDFTNYLGFGNGFNYLKLSRYTNFIGAEPNFPSNGTNKGNAASWEVGDIVQWWNSQGETRFYECVSATSSGTNPPPQNDSNNTHWTLLTWVKPDSSISYFPPDDIDIVFGTVYEQRGMGVRNTLPNTPPPPPPPVPNIPPTVSITQPADQDSITLGTAINIVANAADPDGAIFSVRFDVNGKEVSTKYLSPFSTSYTPPTVGTYTLEATAFDSDGDSTTSTAIQVYVYNPNHFLVLNYTEVSGNDHGTAAASQQMLENIGSIHGFTVVQDSTGDEFNTVSNLQKYEVIIFSNTTGNNLLNATQKANFQNVMDNGGAFIGIHAASEAYRHSKAKGSGTGLWDWYAEMLGASVQDTPVHTAPSYLGTLNHVGTHPTTANLPDPWNKKDEYYYWGNGYYNPDNIPVLEVASTGSQPYDTTRAIAWYKYLAKGGRSFYTGLGHTAAEYSSDPDFITHITDAILWINTNMPPTVSITNVQKNDTIIKDSVVSVLVSATDVDGFVDSVSLMVDNKVVKWDLAQPWSLNYKAVNSGNHTLRAVAYDNDGDSTISLPVKVYVKDTISGDTIILTGNTINENYPAGTYIGTLSGSSSYAVNHEEEDGWFFMIHGDSLLSRMAFDYDAFIGNNLSNSHPKVQIVSAAGNVKNFTITIQPASGKYDDNGYVDQDILNKYQALGDSSLRIGDYIIFNWSNSGGDYYNEYPSLSYPNQIKIMSNFYKKLTINLDNAAGNNTKQPIIITNWLGQVWYREKLTLKKCNACRLTGEYDQSKKTGNKYFTASIHDPFKYRGFGIFRDARTIQNNSGIATIGSGMTKIEVDHLEIMGGGYDGLNFKDDNAGGGIIDSCRVHDNYVHDIKNEGLYMGNTKSISTHGPQQQYTNVIVENNLFVRCGSEGYQFQRGIANNMYRNNVIWSGMVWLMPFQNNQFANQQMGWSNGGHTHRDEIFMGGTGDNSTLIKPRLGEVPSYSSNANSVRNSLYYCLRGNAGFYMNGGNNGFPITNLDSIYIGHTRLNYSIINSQWNPQKSTNAFFIENWSSLIKIGSIFYDFTVTNASNSVVPVNPVQQAVPAPAFENVFGNVSLPSMTVDSIHRWHRWTDIIWGNTSNGTYLKSIGFNVGDHMIFKPGDVVQHWAPKADRWGGTSHPVRLYYCIQTHDATNVEPGVTPGWENFWMRLTWTKPDGSKTYYPPDDFDLVPGSYYDIRGMGLK